MKRIAIFLILFALAWLNGPNADAQFNKLSGCDQFGFCSINNSNLIPIGNACSIVSGTTTTFTAQGIGNANPNRTSVVSINWGDSTLAGTAEITNVTLGGVSMLRGVRAAGDDQNSNSEIWYLANPTGTSANIVVTTSTAIDGITIGVYSLIGYATAPISTTVGTTSASLAYSNKQVALEAGSRTINVSTSLSNLTNDFSSACGPNLWGVHASGRLNGNGQTLTSTISPTSDNPKIALAIWTAVATACDQTGLIFSVDCNMVLVPALIH